MGPWDDADAWIAAPGGPDGGGSEPVATEDEVRTEILQRLAEQAMADPAFRAAARDDLPGALAAYGYALNERELELVLRFRASLADAGVDLDLVEPLTPEQVVLLLGRERAMPDS